MQIILALLILAIPSMPHQSIVIHAIDTVLPALKTQEEKIYDIDEYDMPRPEPVHRVEPEFPEKARKNKIKGAFVILEAVVDKEGNVSELHVLRIVSLQYHDRLKAKFGSDGDLKAMVAASPPASEDTYDFGKVLTEAIIQWRFEPSLYNGKAVPIRMLIDVKFESSVTPL